jgi:hypothetical protein
MKPKFKVGDVVRIKYVPGISKSGSKVSLDGKLDKIISIYGYGSPYPYRLTATEKYGCSFCDKEITLADQDLKCRK